MSLTLVIGNRNYSSWSLRAWWFMKKSGLDFDEVRLPLHTQTWEREIGNYSPARRVPALLDGDLKIWDSLAIFDHLRERFSGCVDWPGDAAARAVGRSISAEMHAGFLAVRQELPLNIRARKAVKPSATCARQVERILDVWGDCRARFADGGPWLLGELSIADVMFAPVALRFLTYGIEVPEPAAQFVRAVEADALIQSWCAAAAAETESLAAVDELLALTGDSITLG